MTTRTQANGRAARDATRAQAQTAARQEIAGLAAQLASLRIMTVQELHAEYTRLFGQESHSRNKEYLGKKLAWGFQERAEGGSPPRVQDQIDRLLSAETKVRFRAYRGRPAIAVPLSVLLAPTKEVVKPPIVVDTKPVTDSTPVPDSNPVVESRWVADERLPPTGTVLRKKYKGMTHAVTVRNDGFEYQGNHFTSLSTIAKVISGTAWNGFAFFGLNVRRSPEPAAKKRNKA